MKAWEDAIQGVVIVNDREIRSGWTERVVTASEPQRVEFIVVAL